MIQIAYQAAYDPYHSCLRLLRLTMFAGTRPLKVGEIRIADFYLLFPHFFGQVRLPPGGQSRAKKNGLLKEPTTYARLPDPLTIFRHMAGIQEAALQTLTLQGLFDKEAFLDGFVKFGDVKAPDKLLDLINVRNHEDDVLLRFIFDTFLSIKFEGVDGIKARTGLMEYRYDFV